MKETQTWGQRALQSSRKIGQDLADVGRFASDGCTGVPDFMFTSCCFWHDLAYDSPSHPETRLQADNKFFGCMKSKLIEEHKNSGWMWCLPYAYWLGVRVLGFGRYKRRVRG